MFYVPNNDPSTKGVLDAWPNSWRAHTIEQKGWLVYGFQKRYMYADRDKISVINNKETEGNVPSVIVPNG